MFADLTTACLETSIVTSFSTVLGSSVVSVVHAFNQVSYHTVICFNIVFIIVLCVAYFLHFIILSNHQVNHFFLFYNPLWQITNRFSFFYFLQYYKHILQSISSSSLFSDFIIIGVGGYDPFKETEESIVWYTGGVTKLSWTIHWIHYQQVLLTLYCSIIQ